MTAVQSAHLALGVCGHLPNRQVVELVAEIAGFFGARMSALMIEDGASDSLASLPFAREYMTRHADWCEIGAGEINARREMARRRARAMLDDVAHVQGVVPGLDVCRGHAHEDFIRAITQYDIVALAAPERAGEWMLLPFAALADAVFSARAATLIVPPRIARHSGPVVALISENDEAAVDLAARLAMAAGENLVLLMAGSSDVVRDAETLAARSPLPRQRLRIVDVDGQVAGLAAILSGIGERMLVVGRTSLPQPGIEPLIRLAAARAIPVLIAGGDKAPSG